MECSAEVSSGRHGMVLRVALGLGTASYGTAGMVRLGALRFGKSGLGEAWQAWCDMAS